MASDVERFAERYGISDASATIEAELRALGSDYRANGYTTMEQADALGESLRLEPGSRLLDLGSGCGWPGLYLASRHGCAVISVDPVHEGCLVTRARADRDELSSRSWTIRGDAEAIPLRSRSVDAVVHGDVMC